RLRGEQQPPVEAHRARARAARPTCALPADRERRVRAAGHATGVIEPGSDLRLGRPSVPALERRLALGAGRDEQQVIAAVHARAPELGHRVQRVAEVRDRVPAAATASRALATSRMRRSIHGRSSEMAAAASRAGARRGSTTWTPPVASTVTRTRRARSERLTW